MATQPTQNYVEVAEKKASNTTSSGIIIESAAGNTKLGYVLSIGPDVKFAQVGDTVLVKWAEGVLLKTEGSSSVLLKEEDIVAVLK